MCGHACDAINMHVVSVMLVDLYTCCIPDLQHSSSTACALLSDHGYHLIQASFQELQSHSWRFFLDPISIATQEQVADGTRS